jgi:hypothetical protein
MVGDDVTAKATVATLISDAGFEPLDAGTLKDAHHLDALAAFIVHLGYGKGMGTTVSYVIKPV